MLALIMQIMIMIGVEIKLYKHRNYSMVLIRAKGTDNKNYKTDVIEDTLEALFFI